MVRACDVHSLLYADTDLRQLTETPQDPPTMVSTPAKYSWIDRDHGVAAIPISRAMDIIAEKGLQWIRS